MPGFQQAWQTQMDMLTVIGIFLLGAATGSILSYAQHRNVVVGYRKLVEELTSASESRENAEIKIALGD